MRFVCSVVDILACSHIIYSPHLQDQELDMKIDKKVVQALKLRDTAKQLFVSSMSASEMGRKIKEKAVTGVFVSILTEDTKAGLSWRELADEALGARWDNAIAPESLLPESLRPETKEKNLSADSVQGLMSDMLKIQPDRSDGIRFVDVHDKASVCGNYRPDIVGVVRGILIPSATGLILDLKKQEAGTYFSHENIFQVSSRLMLSLFRNDSICDSQLNITAVCRSATTVMCFWTLFLVFIVVASCLLSRI